MSSLKLPFDEALAVANKNWGVVMPEFMLRQLREL